MITNDYRPMQRFSFSFTFFSIIGGFEVYADLS